VIVVSISPMTATATVLLDLSVMTAVGSFLASVAVRWRQPAVIGEIIAGILLGPTLLGALPGHLTNRLFPLQERPFLSVLANLGLVLFMFVVGFELDPAHMRQIRSSAAVVSLSSVALPFVLGMGVALLLYSANRGGAGHKVGMLPFVLFLGVAMSITAFPVLARILTGLELHRSRLGTFVMTCAAGADLMAWTMLALVAAAAVGGSQLSALRLVGEMLFFIAILGLVVRPLLRAVLLSELIRRHKGDLPLILIVVGLLLSAWVTTRLGFQPIFGAFAFGAVMPRDAVRDVAPEVPLLVEQASQLLVPVFFITTGLNVNLSSLGVRGDMEALLVLVVACAGKFFGAAGGARISGFDSRRAAAVGVLMNSRGLTELVVIQVGISLGILDSRVASMMIVMAVVTTITATPLFRLLYDTRLQHEDDDVFSQVSAAPFRDSQIKARMLET
jgi:Kef-type K+ transport system membrane component KefB